MRRAPACFDTPGYLNNSGRRCGCCPGNVTAGRKLAPREKRAEICVDILGRSRKDTAKLSGTGGSQVQQPAESTMVSRIMDDNILHDNILRETAVCLSLRKRCGKQDLTLVLSYMYAGIKWQPGCLGTLLCNDLVKILRVQVIS